MRACVDIGGTKVAVSLVDAPLDRAGETPPPLLARRTEATVKTGAPDELAQQIIRMVAASCAELGQTVSSLSAVGVSSCGPFVLRDGLLELAAPNICGGLAGPARGLPNQWMTALLEAPLRQVFETVRVENDAVAALEAERRWGALQGQDHCAYVTWSTGIGVGLCVDGHVLRGKNGNAGHAGHMFVSDDPSALCGCGNVGDIEGLIAGNALARRFDSDAAALFAAALAGESLATQRVDQITGLMARMLYNLVATLDLQRVAIGGSVFWHQRDQLLPRLQAQLLSWLPPLTAGVELVPAGLGMAVGDYAALALVA